jgi:hypothetical protein
MRLHRRFPVPCWREPKLAGGHASFDPFTDRQRIADVRIELHGCPVYDAQHSPAALGTVRVERNAMNGGDFVVID